MGKLLLIMPTRPTLRLTSLSRGSKVNFVMLRVSLKMRAVNELRLLRRLVWLIGVVKLCKLSLRNQADMELVEARGSVNDMTTINSKAASDKRRMESAVHTLHAEIDDSLAQAKSSEEKAKRAMVDAARLADELRAEQDHTTTQAKAKRALETQTLN